MITRYKRRATISVLVWLTGVVIGGLLARSFNLPRVGDMLHAWAVLVLFLGAWWLLKAKGQPGWWLLMPFLTLSWQWFSLLGMLVILLLPDKCTDGQEPAPRTPDWRGTPRFPFALSMIFLTFRAVLIRLSLFFGV